MTANRDEIERNEHVEALIARLDNVNIARNQIGSQERIVRHNVETIQAQKESTTNRIKLKSQTVGSLLDVVVKIVQKVIPWFDLIAKRVPIAQRVNILKLVQTFKLTRLHIVQVNYFNNQNYNYNSLINVN